MKNKTIIVYLAAGLSSRFGGAIKQFSKIGLNGESLIEISMNHAIQAGFEEIIFVVGTSTEEPFKKQFGDEYKGIPVKYTMQTFNPEKRDRPWGTVEALLTAKDYLKCPFVVCNSDDIYGARSFMILRDHLLSSDNSSATLGYRLMDVLPESGAVNRGIFKVDNNSFVIGLSEVYSIKKDDLPSDIKPDEACSMNVFALREDIVPKLESLLKAFIENRENDKRAEFLLSDACGMLMMRNEIRMKLYNSPDKWIGITRPEDVEIVIKEYAEHYKNL
jgi:NDP-sugar pyrophosphorylase family protein